jgi:hypothetical protein
MALRIDDLTKERHVAEELNRSIIIWIALYWTVLLILLIRPSVAKEGNPS